MDSGRSRYATLTTTLNIFRVTLEDPDDDDDQDKCQLVVGLLQKDRRKLKLLGKDNLTIGFAIYKVYL